MIVVALPIRKAAPKEIHIEQLETLAGFQPTPRLLLGHFLHTIRSEERVDGRVRRLEPASRGRLGLACPNRQDRHEDDCERMHIAVIAPFLAAV
jgi:hypothetical protein